MWLIPCGPRRKRGSKPAPDMLIQAGDHSALNDNGVTGDKCGTVNNAKGRKRRTARFASLNHYKNLVRGIDRVRLPGIHAILRRMDALKIQMMPAAI